MRDPIPPLINPSELGVTVEEELLVLEEGVGIVAWGSGWASGALTVTDFLSSSGTLTWSFIPPRQYNLLPQAKYLVPAFESVTVVFPLENLVILFVVLQVSKLSLLTSHTLWYDENWNTRKNPKTKPKFVTKLW